MSIFAAAVIDGADDGQAVTTVSWINNGSNVLSGNAGGATTIVPAFRIQSVTIPQGATINSALLELVQALGHSTSTVNLKIRLDDSDDSAAIANITDYLARTRTTAQVDWNAVASTTTGVPITTPDFASPVQEVVDRAGWVSGADMMPLIEDNGSSSGAYREHAAFEHATYDPPAIEIDYTEAATGNRRRRLILGASQ